MGLDAFDDAAILRISSETALALTIDAFTPIFDDPKTFGRVAAANAVSDIYAMGLKPVLAQGFLGWPIDLIAAEWAGEVIAGAVAFCTDLGVYYAGGHTISSQEPIFGLCVNGFGPSANVKLNSTGRPGDLLYLTKPLGSGIISTAEKKGLLTIDDREAALQFIAAPNRVGESLGHIEGVHALTDVTGFGLVGHLLEMTDRGCLGAILEFEHLHSLQGVDTYLNLGCETSGGERNRHDFQPRLGVECDRMDHLLVDPQTNGGLLIACDPAARRTVESLLAEHGLGDFASPIGRLVHREGRKQVQVI